MDITFQPIRNGDTPQIKLLGIVMNFEIKWKHIVIGFYHEDNIKVKTLNNLISFTALKLYKYKMLYVD